MTWGASIGGQSGHFILSRRNILGAEEDKKKIQGVDRGDLISLFSVDNMRESDHLGVFAPNSKT